MRDSENHVFSSYDPNPIRACAQCGKKPPMVRSMLNPLNGRTVRMSNASAASKHGPRIRK